MTGRRVDRDGLDEIEFHGPAVSYFIRAGRARAPYQYAAGFRSSAAAQRAPRVGALLSPLQ